MKKRRCVKLECSNEELLFLTEGENIETDNGLFTILVPGWYCPSCGACYGGSKDVGSDPDLFAFNGSARARSSDPETSKEAAKAMEGKPAGRLEKAAADWLLDHREGGDAEEVADDVGCKETSMTPRFVSLEEKNIAFRATLKKAKRSKCDRVVWRHTKYRDQELRFNYKEATQLAIRGFYLEASHPLHGWVEAKYVKGHGLWGDERSVYRIQDKSKKKDR